MDKDYKDFDEKIRAVLRDAEEDVPAHIVDDVFARLDNIAESPSGSSEKKIIPEWLKWFTAGIAAAAAAILCFVFIPARKTYTPDNITAMTSDTEVTLSPSLDQMDTPSESIVLPHKRLLIQNNPVKPQETEISQEFHDNDESRPEKHTVNNIKKGPAKEAAKPENDENKKDSSLFSFTDIENEKSKKSIVALNIGGNVASNGNPASLTRSRGFMAPGQLLDAEWIEQLGKESTYSIPLSFGIGTKISLGKNWGINTGLKYTLLQRSFSGIYTKIEGGKTKMQINSDIRHSIHYIGIPIQGYYNILSSTRVKLYAYAGGEVERAIASIYKVKNSPKDVTFKDNVKGIQLSVNGGFGIEFAIANQLGIYVNPGVAYYFDCKQPVSIRTQQPLMMNFEIGFRVDL